MNWVIDEADERSEERNGGFEFWWSRDAAGNVSRMGLTDLAPFRVDLSNLPAGFAPDGLPTFRLKLLSTSGGLQGLSVYTAVSPAANRLLFLQDVGVAEQQYATPVANTLAGAGSTSGGFSPNNGSWEFVLQANGSGVGTAKLGLEVGYEGNFTLVDTTLLTFRDVAEYWSLWSARGETDRVFHNYPIEDGRREDVPIFPVAQWIGGNDVDAQQNSTDRHEKFLLYIHGYNNDLADAQRSTSELYRRLYWTGFRGQLVGLTWIGDDGNIIGDLTLFDPNVKNAFQTAPSAREFLDVKMRAWTNNQPENIDVMAHSLGNLVMWEALRLQEALFPTRPLVHNVIGIEAAIWQEAFEAESHLTYPSSSGLYTVQNPAEDSITYSVDELKKMSWRSWFRQKDTTSLGVEYEHDLTRMLVGYGNPGGGRIIHSYNVDDFALSYGMRVNDDLMREHYDRAQKALQGYRNLSTNTLFNIPGLLAHRDKWAVLNHEHINRPIGAVPMSYGNALNIDAYAIKAWNSVAGLPAPGWTEDGHGDFINTSIPNSSFANLWPWYSAVFRSHAAVPIGEA